MAYMDDSIEFSGAPIVRKTEVYEINGADCLIDAIRFDRDKTTEEEMVRVCSDQLANRQACILAEFAKSQIKNPDHAVYVASVKSGRACKIGVSNAPIKRLESLQNGSHERISITHLFWMPRRAAFGIEGLSLRAIGKMGKRLLGEWVGMTPQQTATVVSTIIGCSTVSTASSEMYRRNCRKVFTAGGMDDRHESYNDDPFWNLVKSGY